MKDEYDERSNGRDSQTKVIYNQLIEWIFSSFFNSTFFYRFFVEVMISNNLSDNYRIQIFNERENFPILFRSDSGPIFRKNMNLKKHFKRRLSSSKRNSLLNPELTSTENVIPTCPPVGHLDHQTDEPTISPVNITPNTDTDNVETVIQ